MINHSLYIFTLLILNLTCCLAQNNKRFDEKELEYLQIFFRFKSYVSTCIIKNEDFSDTVNIKHVLLNYIMTEYYIDSTDVAHFKKDEFPEVEFKTLKEELNHFFRYFSERKESHIAQHLSAIPLRLSSDKCIYEKLTPFQRENTFVYFDDREPEKPLGYMLFAPKIKGKINEPRIWSWTLQFESGHWAFKSLMGTVGLEYFITEGVKAPKPENKIGN